MIVVEGVEKWFGDFQALEGVDLVVGRQEVVVVIGPRARASRRSSAASTGSRSTTGGRIIVDGIELSDDIRNIQEIRREVGMVFQQFNLFPHLTVLENITLGAAPGPALAEERRKQTAHELLERVRIPEQAHKYPGPALRRPAAARRDRPRARDAAEDHALRRADLRPRPGDDQGGARRHGGAGATRA